MTLDKSDILPSLCLSSSVGQLRSFRNTTMIAISTCCHGYKAPAFRRIYLPVRVDVNSMAKTAMYCADCGLRRYDIDIMYCVRCSPTGLRKDDIDVDFDDITMKAVILGDVNVLKMHFVMQTDGLYKRDIAPSYSPCKDIHQVDLNYHGKAVSIQIWNYGEFVMCLSSLIRTADRPTLITLIHRTVDWC